MRTYPYNSIIVNEAARNEAKKIKSQEDLSE
jgi:hypothetical protein